MAARTLQRSSSNFAPPAAGAERPVKTPWRAPACGRTVPLMANIFLALFLIVFGLNLLFGLNVPIWVSGVLALIAGVLLIMEYFRVRVERK